MALNDDQREVAKLHRPVAGLPHPAPAPAPGWGGVPAGRKRPRRRPPGKPGGPAWRERRTVSFALSLALHGAAILAMLNTTLPAPVQEARKPIEVIEVEFVEIPSVKPAQAAAPPPVEREAPKPVAVAPVKPAPQPKPVAAAAPRAAAPRVAPPKRATRVERPAPRKAHVPVKRAPSQAELAQLAAARLKRSEDDVTRRLAQIQAGADKPEAAPAAPAAPAGRPQVSSNSPMGELSGRGITYAPKPPYPEVAKRRVWEGTVQVRVHVNAGGRVERAVVEGSSGFPVLDAAARGAAAAYRFSPLGDGAGATQSGVIPFVFVIR